MRLLIVISLSVALAINVGCVDRVRSESSAERIAVRSLPLIFPGNTNVVFAAPFDIHDEGDHWSVTSDSGWTARVQKDDGDVRFGYEVFGEWRTENLNHSHETVE